MISILQNNILYVATFIGFVLGYFVGKATGKSDGYSKAVFDQQQMEATRIWADKLKDYYEVEK